ncbi:hypothetical protein MKX01_035642 [Papaver californicum]|nr:hypothetical protein MKX01_035642 [Papaver californicum]
MAMMISAGRKLKCVSLIFVVIFAVLVSECSSQISVFKTIHASIKNEISEKVELNIYCKSKDTDMGGHKLTYGGEFAWKFKMNFIGTTLFWCKMWWTDVDGKYTEGSYAIYEAQRDFPRCENQCPYPVRRDGIYGFMKTTNEYELVYPWPK